MSYYVVTLWCSCVLCSHMISTITGVTVFWYGICANCDLQVSSKGCGYYYVLPQRWWWWWKLFVVLTLFCVGDNGWYSHF